MKGSKLCGSLIRSLDQKAGGGDSMSGALGADLAWDTERETKRGSFLRNKSDA